MFTKIYQHLLKVIQARVTKKDPVVYVFEQVLERISESDFYICIAIDRLWYKGLITRKQHVAAKTAVGKYLKGNETILSRQMIDRVIPSRRYHDHEQVQIRKEWLAAQILARRQGTK